MVHALRGSQAGGMGQLKCGPESIVRMKVE